MKAVEEAQNFLNGYVRGIHLLAFQKNRRSRGGSLELPIGGKKMAEGFVYVLVSANSEFVKIGRTEKTPFHRLREVNLYGVCPIAP